MESFTFTDSLMEGYVHSFPPSDALGIVQSAEKEILISVVFVL